MSEKYFKRSKDKILDKTEEDMELDEERVYGKNDSTLTFIRDQDDVLEGRRLDFEEVAVCALKLAFERNPELVNELADNAGGSGFDKNRNPRTGQRKINECRNQLFGADVSFRVDEVDTKIIYHQLAQKEGDRLSSAVEDKDIVCGHTVDDHLDALNEVLIKTHQVIH
jgi:hypothetical protein